MTRTQMRAGVSWGAIAMMLATAAPALAGAPSDTSNVSVVETIVVTAQRRSEDVQSVPFAMTAVSGETLQQQHIVQLDQLKNIDSSVQFKLSATPNTSAFAIRGVGTPSFSSGIEQSVSTVVDGVVLADPSAVATLADIDHVELLKGPQGMLFGKNASSGVVSIITREPVLHDFGGAEHLSFGVHGEQVLQGIVNVPLGDTLALRLVASHQHLDGWVTDPVFKGMGINPVDVSAIRGKLLWRPTDDLKIVFGAEASYTGDWCCASTIRATVDPRAGIPVSDALYGVVESPNNFQVTEGALGKGYARLAGASLSVDYHLANGFDLAAVTGYHRSHRSNFWDADYGVFNYADINGGWSDYKNFSQEVRVASPLGGRFDYVAGLYYYYQDNIGVIGQSGTVTLPAKTTAVIPPTAVLASLARTAVIKGDDYAAFAQGNLHLTDTLTLTAGGRVTHDNLDLTFAQGPLFSNLPLIGGAPPQVAIPPAPAVPSPPFSPSNYVGYAGPYTTPCYTAADPTVVSGSRRPNCFPALQQSVKATNFSWRITLQNKFSDHVMGYLTAARGYKGPGFSALSLSGAQLASGQADQTIKPEIPTSYEAGLKTELFDRRLIFNADVFSTEYKDFQAQVTTSTPVGFISIIHNAGGLKTRGAEVSIIGKPSSGLTLSANATYLYARYQNFSGVPCWAHIDPVTLAAGPAQPGCIPAGQPNANTLNADGFKLAGAPTWQYSLSMSYEHPDVIKGLTGYARANWNWQDDVNYIANNDPGGIQKAFGLLGGEGGVGPEGDKWRLSVYVTNLFNEHWASGISAASSQPLNPGGYLQYLGPDSFRHVGIRLDAKF